LSWNEIRSRAVAFADLYAPLTMPPGLAKVHEALDRLYRKKSLTSFRHCSSNRIGGWRIVGADKQNCEAI
jgi:hypothetical protein